MAASPIIMMLVLFTIAYFAVIRPLARRSAGAGTPTSNMRTASICCAEIIKKAALKCKHCGEYLARPPNDNA